MPKEYDIITELDAFKDALFLHDDGYRFIKFHKIWRGFMKYGWASKVLLGIAIIFSFHFLSIVYEWILHVYEQGGNIIANTSSMFLDLKDLVFLEGGVKYLILICVEILIFHCSVKTINILDGKDRKPELQDFIAAEKRMIAVSFKCFIQETIIAFVLGMVLSVVGLKPYLFIPMFIVHSYFIGYAFFDNYNEQYGFNIKESAKLVNERIGAVLGIGMVAVLLFKLPILGAIAAPMLGATTATMYLYGEGVHWPTLPRIFHEDKLRLKPIKKKSKLKA